MPLGDLMVEGKTIRPGFPALVDLDRLVQVTALLEKSVVWMEGAGEEKGVARFERVTVDPAAIIYLPKSSTWINPKRTTSHGRSTAFNHAGAGSGSSPSLASTRKRLEEVHAELQRTLEAAESATIRAVAAEGELQHVVDLYLGLNDELLELHDYVRRLMRKSAR